MFQFSLYKRKYFSYPLILCIIALCGIGLVILNSAMINDIDHDSTMTKQIMGIGIGFALMIFLMLVDYHFILKFVPLIYIGNAVLLFLVLSPLGVNVNGAQRWLKLGIQIQPSEFCKIALILVLAWFFWRYEHRINSPLVVFGSAFIFLFPALLVLKEPDLSTTLVITFIYIAMIYCAKISYKWIGLVLAIMIPLMLIAFYLLITYPDFWASKFYQARRILSWLYPDRYVSTGNNTQQENSVLAIASGQLFGKGINNTSFESVKNGNFLSEENCDFIFAVIGEELGFVGSIVIIGIFLIMIFICLRIAAKAKDMAGRMICVGMTSLIAFQSFVNVGVASKLLPNTGLPLPFISAGVSSMLSLFIGMGLVLNVALQRVDESRFEW